MNPLPVRLAAQQLAGPRFTTARDLVAWFGAVQAQDYAGAKWAVAQRVPGLSDADIERAFAAGEIVRTHVLRPTWHFVAAADVRWMLALTGARVAATNASQSKKLGLTAAVLRKGADVLHKALVRERALTRLEIARVLRDARLGVPSPLHVTCLLLHAETEGLVCSGGLRGKQHTYALLDDRVPRGGPMARDEAAAELARRYFQSHGPATLGDFAWWSGLALQDARAGIAAAGDALAHVEQGGATYWWSADARSRSARRRGGLWLLPNYDEYIVAYSDRDALLRDVRAEKLDARGNVLFNNTIVIGGSVVGTWRRTRLKRDVVVAATTFRRLLRGEAARLDRATAAYGDFLGLPARVSVTG